MTTRRRETAPKSDRIASLSDVLKYARGYEKRETDPRAKKKNFAEGFSRAMATLIAAKLRRHFAGITPDEHGRKQESRARTSKGFKKLDVNYSTPELGLALGVSLKSIHSKTVGSGYRRNYSRNDNELRAEAMDYHQRQPFAVLIGLLFLPIDACDDRTKGKSGDPPHSSFASAVRYFRDRGTRSASDDPLDLLEAFFIGLYDENDDSVVFFDVAESPPKLRRPDSSETLTLEQVVDRIRICYDRRNVRPFEWKD